MESKKEKDKNKTYCYDDEYEPVGGSSGYEIDYPPIYDDPYRYLKW